MKSSYKILKVLVLSLIVAGGGIFLAMPDAADARTNIPGTLTTGAPGESNCTRCHTGTANNAGSGELTISGLPASYTLGQAVTVSVKMKQANFVQYGFQVTALDDTGKQAGTFTVTDTARLATAVGTYNGNQRSYVTQKSAGAQPTTEGEAVWSFTWNAPATDIGKVTFYASGLAGNGSSSSGDNCYTTSVVVNAPPSIGPLSSVSAASFSGAALTAESIVAAFGNNLATATQGATTVPLPTTLAGTTVKVKDSLGTERAAPLFFVSGGQVNYLVPAGTAGGQATVTITSGDGAASAGNVQVDPVAPGFFSANANGQGIAAAVVLRVKADNSQNYEPIANYDNNQMKFVPAPIDLGPETDQLFLVLYGTGIRNRSALTAVTATIGGEVAEVLYAGVQPDFIGLDQVTLRIPRVLKTRGEVNIVVIVDGKTANTVTVDIY